MAGEEGWEQSFSMLMTLLLTFTLVAAASRGLLQRMTNSVVKVCLAKVGF